MEVIYVYVLKLSRLQNQSLKLWVIFTLQWGCLSEKFFFGGAWLTSLPGNFTTGKVPRCPLTPQHAWAFWGREKLLTAEADKEKCSKELMKIVHRKIRTT
jgi:hypothetical protein